MFPCQLTLIQSTLNFILEKFTSLFVIFFTFSIASSSVLALTIKYLPSEVSLYCLIFSLLGSRALKSSAGGFLVLGFALAILAAVNNYKKHKAQEALKAQKAKEAEARKAALAAKAAAKPATAAEGGK